MTLKLLIFNPSDYPRSGYVTIPWQPIYQQTNIMPSSLVLHDQNGVELPFQIDYIDPDDKSRDALIIFLKNKIPAGHEDYSSHSDLINVKAGSPSKPQENVPRLEVITDGKNGTLAAKLSNDKLSVYVNLTSTTTENNQKTWYAGAATSVLIHETEMLDPFLSFFEGWKNHDPEKRCIQIDKIQLLRPPWEATLYQTVHLFNQSYELIAKSIGALRVSITIASAPFDFRYQDPITNANYNLKCRLYRVINLYADSDYLMEELFVKGAREGHPVASDVNLFFIAHYFSYIGLGHNPVIYSFLNVPDWFAIGFPHYRPYPGYGFATDVHAGQIFYPHPNFPHSSNAYKTFSWQLSPCRFANCLHLFMRNQSCGFDTRIGNCWYELILKPLIVKLSRGN